VNRPPVIFPNEVEYRAWYIWSQELVFKAKIDSIWNVTNADTNHRILLQA